MAAADLRPINPRTLDVALMNVHGGMHLHASSVYLQSHRNRFGTAAAVIEAHCSTTRK